MSEAKDFEFTGHDQTGLDGKQDCCCRGQVVMLFGPLLVEVDPVTRIPRERG